MSLRGPRFPSRLADAPPWVQQGVARFEALQRQSRENLGSDPSKFVRHESLLYFPNVVIHWNAGMIGVIAAFVGAVGLLTIVVVGWLFMDGVPGWALIGLAACFGLAVVSMGFIAVKAPKGPRRDGMYLLDEGAAFVRGEMCSWAPREAIECFEVYTITSGTHSHRESLKLRSGDNVELAVGKRPTLREVAEEWRRG